MATLKTTREQRFSELEGAIHELFYMATLAFDLENENCHMDRLPDGTCTVRFKSYDEACIHNFTINEVRNRAAKLREDFLACFDDPKAGEALK